MGILQGLLGILQGWPGFCNHQLFGIVFKKSFEIIDKSLDLACSSTVFFGLEPVHARPDPRADASKRTKSISYVFLVISTWCQTKLGGDMAESGQPTGHPRQLRSQNPTEHMNCSQFWLVLGQGNFLLSPKPASTQMDPVALLNIAPTI